MQLIVEGSLRDTETTIPFSKGCDVSLPNGLTLLIANCHQYTQKIPKKEDSLTKHRACTPVIWGQVSLEGLHRHD